MEAFKAQLGKRRVLLAIGILLTLLVAVFVVPYTYKLASAKYADDWLRGFMLGTGTGWLIALAIILGRELVKSIRALGSAEQLQALYIKENDERARTVGEKASTLGYNIALVALAITSAGIGQLYPQAGLALFLAMAGLVFIRLGLWVYYNAKY